MHLVIGFHVTLYCPTVEFASKAEQERIFQVLQQLGEALAKAKMPELRLGGRASVWAITHCLPG